MKSYECKYPGCRQMLMSKQGYKEHQRLHTSEMPYSCRYNCGKTFRWRSSLAHHEKSSHGEFSGEAAPPAIHKENNSSLSDSFAVAADKPRLSNTLEKRRGGSHSSDSDIFVPVRTRSLITHTEINRNQKAGRSRDKAGPSFVRLPPSFYERVGMSEGSYSVPARTPMNMELHGFEEPVAEWLRASSSPAVPSPAVVVPSPTISCTEASLNKSGRADSDPLPVSSVNFHLGEAETDELDIQNMTTHLTMEDNEPNDPDLLYMDPGVTELADADDFDTFDIFE